MSPPTFSREKLGELVLYIALKSETDPFFDAAKLEKLLFNCDFSAHLRLGKPITGVEYVRIDRGPSPGSLKSIQEELEASGSLKVRSIRFFQYGRSKTIALREPDLDLFSASEIAIVDGVISAAEGLSAADMTEKKQEFTSWKLAEPGETIPYETALLGSGTSSSSEVRGLAESLENRASDVVGTG